MLATDFLTVQRHQAELLATLDKQMKELKTKEAAKVQQEEEQPILSGMKLIGAGPGSASSALGLLARY